MAQASQVVANLKRVSCNVLATSSIDKTEIVRILTEEAISQKIEINDDVVSIAFIAAARLYLRNILFRTFIFSKYHFQRFLKRRMLFYQISSSSVIP